MVSAMLEFVQRFPEGSTYAMHQWPMPISSQVKLKTEYFSEHVFSQNDYNNPDPIEAEISIILGLLSLIQQHLDRIQLYITANE